MPRNRSVLIGAVVLALTGLAGVPASADPPPSECASQVPTYTRAAGTQAGLGTATVTWVEPRCAGSGITSYELTTSSGQKTLLPPTARKASVRGISLTMLGWVRVRALNASGEGGDYAVWSLRPTRTLVSSNRKRVKSGKPFRITARVGRFGQALPGMPVVLQRLTSDSPTWSDVGSGYAGRAGRKSWTVRQSGPTYYRVVSRGRESWLGSYSRTVAVRRR